MMARKVQKNIMSSASFEQGVKHKVQKNIMSSASFEQGVKHNAS